MLAACGTFAAQPDNSRQLPEYARVVDLSHTITQDMPTPPGEMPPQIVRAERDDSVQALSLSVQSGTMLLASSDQPLSTLEQRSPRELIASAVVLDVRTAAQEIPSYRLPADAIRAWEARHGTIPADCIVLLATGWDMRWGNPADYFNLDQQQEPQVPGITADAVALLRERGVRGLGVDTPATIAPKDDWLLLANLTNVEQLPPNGTTLVIGALKIQGSSASPARVLALLP
jgi:kynurenine formamidase